MQWELRENTPDSNSSNTFALLLIDSMSQAEEFVVAALGEEVLTTIIDQDITPQLIIADYHLAEDYKGAAGWADDPQGIETALRAIVAHQGRSQRSPERGWTTASR